MISVIIPTYQHAGTIAECLDSVFEQTLPPGEVIVVNDGSTDGTEKALGPYLDRITLINQANQGPQAARNRGWKAATSDRIIFCDADVRMRPDMLERLSAALDANPEASYAYSAFRFGWKKFPGVPFDADRLRRRNFIHTTCLVRAADFPGFDPAVKRLQDWDVWLTMLEAGKTGVLVPDMLFTVAVHGASRIGSVWMPRIAYRVPWRWFGWAPPAVRRYQEARAAIARKHHLLLNG